MNSQAAVAEAEAAVAATTAEVPGGATAVPDSLAMADVVGSVTAVAGAQIFTGRDLSQPTGAILLLLTPTSQQCVLSHMRLHFLLARTMEQQCET
jgi:hypothetical protein